MAGGPLVWTFSWNVPTGNDGAIAVSVSAVDTAGNANATATGKTSYTIDNTAPVGYTVNINQATINDTNETALSFTFAGAEVGATYNYSIDDTNGGTPPVTGTAAVISATQQISGINVTSLTDGVLTLTVTLTDTAGNIGSPATDTISKDATLPVISTPTPNNGGSTSDTTPTISVQFTEAGSGIDTATAVITVDGNDVTAFATVNGTSLTYMPLSALATGVRNVIVNVSDLAGNAAAQYSWAFAIITDDTTITSTTDKSSVLADGASQAKITATVLDPSGNPVTSGNVTFSTTIGSLTATTVALDGQGRAITYAYSTETGQTTVTATFTTGSGSVKTSSVAVNFTETPKSISVISGTASVPANGTSNTTITATILNISTPISGGTVTFTTTRGTLSAGSVVSDVNGQASVTITSASAGSSRITAYYNTGSQIISSYVDITFTEVDVTSPTATQWPADNATGVALNAKPYIQFSELMDESTLVAGNIEIRLYNAQTTPISASIAISTVSGATRVTFTPDSNLTAGTQYFFYTGAGVKDLANNSLATTWTTANKASHEFTARALYTNWNIPLVTGWNLISFPLIPNNTAISTILSGISANVNMVKHYNASTEAWLSYVPGVEGALSTMEDGKGYWIEMTAPATLTINGTENQSGGGLPLGYQVIGGKWNLVGFKAVAQMLASIYLGTPGTSDIMQKGDNTIVHSATEDRNLEMGSGYWLYHDGSNYTIIPQN